MHQASALQAMYEREAAAIAGLVAFVQVGVQALQFHRGACCC